jgi:ribosome-interacting GTPase 1
MADVLIETVNSNPYDSVVADTSTKISNMDEQIQMVTNEISKLEKSNPSSPTLSQLRDRLASLQREKQDLTQTNASAKSLSQSFNQ